MTSSGRRSGYCQYSMFYDVCLEGKGVVSSCPCCHKYSRNLCKVMVVSKNIPSRDRLNSMFINPVVLRRVIGKRDSFLLT